MKCGIAIGMAVGALVAGGARGDELARWTFEVSKPLGNNVQDAGPYAAELGLNAASSFASGHHLSTGTDYSNPSGNGSLESFSSNEWHQDDYYQFTTSTIGYRDITIGWDQARSSTGPDLFQLSYSLDGVNFTPMLDYTALFNDVINGGPWNQNTYIPNYTIAPVGAAVPKFLVNQPIVYFRLTSQVTPGNTAGTNRVDNVVISGNVPSPGSAALIGLAALTATRRRR